MQNLLKQKSEIAFANVYVTLTVKQGGTEQVQHAKAVE